MKVSHRCICSIVILLGFFIPAMCVVGDTHACRPLTSEACVDTVGNGRYWSFNQSSLYWTVVAVTPDATDDKDIYLYTQCNAGDVLASSTQISGTDFIVGDFNHNTVGTYYPTTVFGTETDLYTVEWVTGGEIFPISTCFWVTTGGSPSPCNLVRIWDIFLEEGVEYRVEMEVGAHPDVFLSLFRNPGTSDYWAGRGDSEWKIDENTAAFVYVPPATDWYGLVAFPSEVASYGAATRITIEKLNDCIALDPGDCFYTPIYSPGGGPATDYEISTDFDVLGGNGDDRPAHGHQRVVSVQ